MVELNVCICNCGIQLVKSGNICYNNILENMYFIIMQYVFYNNAYQRKLLVLFNNNLIKKIIFININ